MTTDDITPIRSNKCSYYCHHHSLSSQELREEIISLQRSVANLRKDIPELIAEKILEKDKQLRQA